MKVHLEVLWLLRDRWQSAHQSWDPSALAHISLLSQISLCVCSLPSHRRESHQPISGSQTQLTPMWVQEKIALAEEGLPPVEAQPEAEEFAVPEVPEEPGYILVSPPTTPERVAPETAPAFAQPPPAAPEQATRDASAAQSAAAAPEQATRGESAPATAPAQQARSASEPVVYAAAIPAAPILSGPAKTVQLPKAESAARQEMPPAGALKSLFVYIRNLDASSNLTAGRSESSKTQPMYGCTPSRCISLCVCYLKTHIVWKTSLIFQVAIRNLQSVQLFHRTCPGVSDCMGVVRNCKAPNSKAARGSLGICQGHLLIVGAALCSSRSRWSSGRSRSEGRRGPCGRGSPLCSTTAARSHPA